MGCVCQLNQKVYFEFSDPVDLLAKCYATKLIAGLLSITRNVITVFLSQSACLLKPLIAPGSRGKVQFIFYLNALKIKNFRKASTPVFSSTLFMPTEREHLK